MSGLDISQCLGRNRYTAKDAAKAAIATKYIGRGSERSSTNAYARAIGPLYANTGSYTHSDIVWISVEGARSGRLDHDIAEIRKATQARATIITDTLAHRERPYNIGERQVAALLSTLGYKEVYPGRWRPCE